MSSTAPRPSARRSPSGSSIPDQVFARAAPFALFIAFIAVQPLVDAHLDARWIVALRGVAVAALLAYFWRHYTELTESPALTARQWSIAIAAGAVVFAAWLAFDSGWAAFDTGKPFVPTRGEGSLDPTLVALRLFGLVAVVPVMEELFWRSFVMRWIDGRNFLAVDPRRASALAIVVSSVVFASEHALWFAGLLAGLIYAGLFVGIGNLRAALVSHATTNGLLGGWILATRDWRFW
jgi:CAAX prenyl protease-like protein